MGYAPVPVCLWEDDDDFFDCGWSRDDDDGTSIDGGLYYYPRHKSSILATFDGVITVVNI